MGATYQTPVTNAAVADAATQSQAEVAQQLIERARELAPVIRNHAADTERERRVAKPVRDALIDAGFQRLLTPRSLGGLEVDPITCARIVEELALTDSAAGWALQGPNVNAWWAKYLPNSGVEELYGSNPSRITAAAFHPQQRAIEVSGGYRVTGCSPLASGIRDSEWVLFSAFVMDGDRPRMTDHGPSIIAVILPASDVKIIDTWDTLGMRGTDSNDGAFNDVFVPTHRTFVLDPTVAPGSRFEGPLYRFPAAGIIAMFTASVLLATARSAINELKDLAGRKTPFGSMKTLRDRAVVQTSLADAEAILRSARAFFYDAMADVWSRCEARQSIALEQRADLLLAAINAGRSSATVTDIVHRLAGTTGIYKRSPIERFFRDAHTLRHHGFTSESKLETVGQIYLGVPPDFPLIGF